MMLSFILTDLLSRLNLVAQYYDCEKKMEGSCEKFGMTKHSDKMKSIEQKSCGRKTLGISLYMNVNTAYKKSEEPYKSHLCGDSPKDRMEKSWQH